MGNSCSGLNCNSSSRESSKKWSSPTTTNSGHQMVQLSSEKSDFYDARSTTEELEQTTSERQLLKYAIPSTQSSTSRYYNMGHQNRGLAIIYNHTKFNSRKYPPRNGTEKDVARLIETLPILGFKKNNIVVFNDLIWADMRRSVRDLLHQNKATLESSDCIIVFILSHGESDNQIMARDKSYDLYDFINLFTPDNYDELATKPKIFCVQACRGNERDFGVKIVPQGPKNVKDEFDTASDVYTHPVFADLFIALSSYPNHGSFRNKEGSWFIQELCNVISKCDLEDYDLNDIMTETNAHIAKRVSRGDEVDSYLDKLKQISTFSSSLVKKVYFKGQRQS